MGTDVLVLDNSFSFFQDNHLTGLKRSLIKLSFLTNNDLMKVWTNTTYYAL